MYRSLLYKKIGNMILSRLAFKVAVIFNRQNVCGVTRVVLKVHDLVYKNL
jgi:hypothetical protein